MTLKHDFEDRYRMGFYEDYRPILESYLCEERERILQEKKDRDIKHQNDISLENIIATMIIKDFCSHPTEGLSRTVFVINKRIPVDLRNRIQEREFQLEQYFQAEKGNKDYDMLKWIAAYAKKFAECESMAMAYFFLKEKEKFLEKAGIK